MESITGIVIKKYDNKGKGLIKPMDSLFSLDISVLRECKLTIENTSNNQIETYLFSGEVNIPLFESLQQGEKVTLESDTKYNHQWARVYQDDFIGNALLESSETKIKEEIEPVAKLKRQPIRLS
jgi:hypothetical protein